MSKSVQCSSKTIGWLVALPLVLLASGFTPVAAQAKGSEVSPVSSAIALSDAKTEASQFSINPRQYVATRGHYRYRPYYHRVRQPHKFYTYRYLYNPYTRRYEYRLVYLWR
jgi:hypothetical protein